jgi:sugar lactone lactonase YvrE
MSAILRGVAWTIAVVVGIGLLAATTLWIRYGGGGPFPEDRTRAPERSMDSVELVANLEWPPGNVAVAPSGRLFFSLHPEANPPTQVAELIDGQVIPYPPDGRLPEGIQFQSVLSLRVDQQDRLWLLDYALHGTGQPRLLAFDLSRDEMVHRYDFPPEIAGLGSHLNDFQVSPDGSRIYIADASIMARTPALIVYDLASGQSRRLLEGHPSVTAERFVPVVQGIEMAIFGVFAIRPGVDSIALSRDAEWLYYAPVTNEHMYRIRRSSLDDPNLSPGDLAEQVEVFARKTLSDGITTDEAGNIYLSDPNESAVVILGRDRQLRTLLKDPALRWPDGFSFGPGDWVYVTCSALHHVIMRGSSHIRSNAPYQIYRFKALAAAQAGH